MTETHLAVFKGKKIRRILHNDEWWFSIVDIIEVLTGTERPRKYWSDLKKKLSEEGYDALSEKIGQLKMQSSDGKYYETDCASQQCFASSSPSLHTKPSPSNAGWQRLTTSGCRGLKTLNWQLVRIFYKFKLRGTDR